MTKCFSIIQIYEHNFNCLKSFFEKWKIKSKESESKLINEIKKDEENIKMRQLKKLIMKKKESIEIKIETNEK